MTDDRATDDEERTALTEQRTAPADGHPEPATPGRPETDGQDKAADTRPATTDDGQDKADTSPAATDGQDKGADTRPATTDDGQDKAADTRTAPADGQSATAEARPADDPAPAAATRPSDTPVRRATLDGAAAADRAEAAADRANAILVVVVLLIDAALLAMLELMFLTASVGSVPMPLSALVALLSAPWLVRRAGELAGVAGASAPLVVWLVTIVVLGFFGPGGDVLLVGDWQALLLLAAELLPGAFVLGRVIRAHREPTPPNAA